MRNGFTFKERHSSDFGVTVKTKSRPLRPSVKTALLDLPCRDGVYDFSSVNALGRECFNERVFIIEISVCAEEVCALQDKLSQLSLWLEGSGELIFDDMPLIRWNCTVSDEIIYMPERGGTKSVIEVSMRAVPFGRAVFGSDGPALGDVLCLGTPLPVGLADLNTHTFEGDGTIAAVNWGDRPVSPVISISGAMGTVTVSSGGRALSFEANGPVTLDLKKQRVRDENGNDLPVSGSFFELGAGKSYIGVSGSGSKCVKVSFEPEYMYNFHADDIEWG